MERNTTNARIILVRQLQDAMFELSANENDSDEKNLELFNRLGTAADQMIEMMGLTISQIDEDGNAYVKFVFSHVWDDPNFKDLFQV